MAFMRSTRMNIPDTANPANPKPPKSSWTAFARTGVKSAVFFVGIALVVAAFALLHTQPENAKALHDPLWLRFWHLLGRITLAMTRQGARPLELILLPACAAWGACFACRQLLPGRWREPLIGGLLYGFSPYMLSLLAYGVAREAFGYALLPFLLLAMLRASEPKGTLFAWLAVFLHLPIIFFTRAIAPAALLCAAVVWFHGRNRSEENPGSPLHWAWLIPGVAALLVFVASPAGGWMPDAYPGTLILRDNLNLTGRMAGLVVLRSSLLPPPRMQPRRPHTSESSRPAHGCFLPWPRLFQTGGHGSSAGAWRFPCPHLLPYAAWWLGITMPAATVAARIGFWPMMPAVMLMTALLAALLLARVFEGLSQKTGRAWSCLPHLAGGF